MLKWILIIGIIIGLSFNNLPKEVQDVINGQVAIFKQQIGNLVDLKAIAEKFLSDNTKNKK